MRKRKGNALVFLLALLGVAIYIFFFEEKEKPFVPYYYTWDGREIYYQSKPNQPYSTHDHYVLAVTQIPYAASSPRDKPSEPFGQEARDFVRGALRSRDIYLERLGNSIYVYVWLDAPGDSSDVKSIEQRMLNTQLISRGYSKYLPSRTPTGIINPTYEKVFLALQKEAQARHAGIWRLAASSPEKRAKSSVSGYRGERRVLIDPNEPDEDTPQISRVASVNVVITPKGKKYHYASCRTVRGRYTVLTVAQARKRGYKPCKVCSPPTR